MSQKPKCKYHLCRCEPRQGDPYCSEYCEWFGKDMIDVKKQQGEVPPGDVSKAKCGCGHANCAMLS